MPTFLFSFLSKTATIKSHDQRITYNIKHTGKINTWQLFVTLLTGDPWAPGVPAFP